MEITDLSIRNNFIEYRKLSFDFTNTGIYRLSGKNGAGKTSIMEQIIFGKYEAEFSSLKIKDIWKNNRNWLFSYIPQGIIEYKLSVAEYLAKGNVNIGVNDVYTLLKEFELEESILQENFIVLSGGEKKKIQIICGILKDTPYLFIDEPTNNLDNAAVESFNKILLKLAKEKTIVLISHDDRLKVNENANYQIGDNLDMSVSKNILVNRSSFFIKDKAKPKLVRLLISLLRNYSQIVTLFILFTIYIVLGIFSHVDLEKNLNTEDMPPSDIILVQASTYYDAAICDNYIEGEGLSIDKKQYDRYISYNDVYEKLLKQEGIDELLFTDYEYQEEISRRIYDGTIEEQLNFVACPKEYYLNFWDNCLLDYGINLVEGNIPIDNGNEVAISRNLLCKYFGYKEDNVDEAIGDIIRIVVNETKLDYQVVGFTYFDYAMLSYNPKNNFGVYSYNEDTFEDFVFNQVTYENSTDGWPGMVREMIVITNNGYEQSVLNYLIQNYPAGIYYSNHFSSVWSKTYNRGVITDFLLPVLIISAIFSVAFIIINKYSFKSNYSILKDFGNYYINRRKLINVYRISVIGSFLIITFLAFLLNTLLSPFSYISNYYFSTSSVIILIPLFLSLIIRSNR